MASKQQSEAEKKGGESSQGWEQGLVSTLLVTAILSTTTYCVYRFLYLPSLSRIKQTEEDKADEEIVNKSRENAPPLQQVILSPNSAEISPTKRRIMTRHSITIVHASVTGTCQRYASDLYKELQKQLNQQQQLNPASSSVIQFGHVQDWDWWDELLNPDDEDEEETKNANTGSKNQNNSMPIVCILLPTHHQGAWPTTAISLEQALQDIQHDWRIEQKPLMVSNNQQQDKNNVTDKKNRRVRRQHRLGVAVFGMGSSAYDDDDTDATNSTMGRPAKECWKSFCKLGAKPLGKSVGIGDDTMGNDDAYSQWKDRVLSEVLALHFNQKNKKNIQGLKNKRKQQQNKTSSSSCGCNSSNTTDAKKQKNTSPSKSNDDDVENDQASTSTTQDENEEEEEEEDDESVNDEIQITDLEDMGQSITSVPKSNKKNTVMVTPSQASALKKEGYKLVGTHSAVKLCRWTKHQLRGRGGCYKHTFYGITSYQCMEATPSLACANKCVFCWRHHKNPVAKSWKWKQDDPQFIVDQAVKTHVDMIRETRGIPGVDLNRWQEAHTVRHCALSLVGEPIMYPRINELLDELHKRHISTFLVTNGQHPDAIQRLHPITQLYVSVDAPTRTSLIEIDRPLFNDAWERLQQSLKYLRQHQHSQRTVARLTVVKGWNSDDIEGYAKLVAMGRVSLIEVKGVTFCGKSDASNLNMSNSPWHHEIVQLCRNLRQELLKLRQEQIQKRKEESSSPQEEEENEDDLIPEYGLACEHAHSCSVLLARKDKFFVKKTTTNDNAAVDNDVGDWYTWIDYDKFQFLVHRHHLEGIPFTVQDYRAKTPSWALFGSSQLGFDPLERRHYRKRKHPKYTKFDEDGIPTHNHNHEPLSESTRSELRQMLVQRQNEIGSTASVTTTALDGEKRIQDASLMFRGMVICK